MSVIWSYNLIEHKKRYCGCMKELKLYMYEQILRLWTHFKVINTVLSHEDNFGYKMENIWVHVSQIKELMFNEWN